MPLLEGEERLKLLNLQHNYISKIENLVSLPSLIYLDLYDNEIKEISHLHTVPSLKVLMLGKNNIERIRSLQSVSKLDVLDLHSNKISKIENLNHLSELRVLNLANNAITAVDSLHGLTSLTELNLRRNTIESVNGLSNCPKLQRIFISQNKIEKFEKVASLKDAPQLTELALEFNPICNNQQEYLAFCFDSCPNLKQLDNKAVTDQMRQSRNITKNSDSLHQKVIESLPKSPKKEEPLANTLATVKPAVETVQPKLVTAQIDGNQNAGPVISPPPACGEPDKECENQLKSIKLEWEKEESDLRKSYSLNKKLKPKERNTMVSGRAEIEGT